MRNVTLEGIVIKRRNFGEADRIITVLTKKRGKIQVKAMGVRRIISRRSPHIELLNRSFLSLHQGKTMPILTEAQTIEDHGQIKEDLTKVGFAYHLCELIDGLCADNQEHEEVFDLFSQTLVQLNKENDIAPIIHDFEIKLLSHLGFFPAGRVQPHFDTTEFIEGILEKKLKTRSLLSHFK